MIEQRIQQQFFESADLLYQAAEQLARPLAMAAQMVVDAITGGNRILCAAHGLAALDADYLAARLAGRFEQERPGLAAWSLSAQARDAAGLDLARLLQAHGHPGDVLVMLEPLREQRDAWAAALAAAHSQEMSVIALTGGNTDEWRGLLEDTDIQIRVSHAREPRVIEAQRVLLHALADAVDMQLLGSDE
ncbi:SIS domain-containing protein [Roseateles sp. DC23W]|uniref:SIS domain-containing protein n=1 Tax=Pelomonas dachongensis TaxID=3299029 RepID=A0ABW7EQF0_9BURK